MGPFCLPRTARGILAPDSEGEARPLPEEAVAAEQELFRRRGRPR